MLVRADQLRLLEHVSLHGALQIPLRRLTEVTELGVERVQLEEVPMAADRGTRTGMSALLPIVQSLAVSPVDALGGRRNVVRDPVHERAFGRLRVRCVGIVDDEREASRTLGGTGPREGRRGPGAIAGEI